MEQRRRITLPDGRTVDAIALGFQAGGEHWNEYLADDQSVIRIKLVVSDVFRLEDQYDPEGNPMYLVKSTNIMSVSAPEKLRRPPGG